MEAALLLEEGYQNDFDFMRQDGDIGSMDYDQAVKNGDIFFP